MSRLDEIKARAEQVHWTSTSIEQAMARMASSAADVPWLVAEVERLTAERDALAAQVARVESLAEDWRYKGQFGWGPWQIGEGPDPEGYVMDHCASALRDALAADTQPTDQEVSDE